MLPVEYGKYRLYYAVYPDGTAKVDSVVLIENGQPIPMDQWDSLSIDLTDRHESFTYEPDWEAFYNLLEHSQIELLLMSSGRPEFLKLAMEFSKRGGPGFDVHRFKSYWDSLMPYVSFTPEHIALINTWVLQAHLPFTIGPDKLMILEGQS